MNKIETIKFDANDSEVSKIQRNLARCIKHAMFEMDKKGLAKEYKEENFEEKCEAIKFAMLGYAAKVAGIKNEFSSATDVCKAFGNATFESIFNSIIVEALPMVMLRDGGDVISKIAEFRTVGVGDSATFIIKPKALPRVQKSSYAINVVPMETYVETAKTIAPQPYKVGVTLDLIRMLANDYNLAEELARVALAIKYTQYAKCVSLIYDTTALTGTPFYQANFAPSTMVQLAEDVRMANGGADVSAYGTLVAFQAVGAITTTNFGFVSQDEMIKNGFLGRAFGIDNVVLPQFSDLYLPMTTANMSSLRTIPNNKILLLPNGDKMVKAVMEDWFGVDLKEARQGSLRRPEYVYNFSFNAEVVSQFNYGIIGTTASN